MYIALVIIPSFSIVYCKYITDRTHWKVGEIFYASVD